MNELERTNNTIWCETYRPLKLDDFIGNKHIIDKVKLWIESNDIPHILFYGPFGTGKSTLAKIIVNTLECDYLYINAADENGVETIRQKVTKFASTIGFSDIKIVILDEAHQITFGAQQILNNILEAFSKNTRFILTSNYIERIAGSVVSRCQEFQVVPPSKAEVAQRLSHILQAENVTFTKDDLATLINAKFPDIRKIINTAQSFNVDGVLKIDKHEIIESNYFLKIVDLLKTTKNKSKTYTEIRQLLADNKVRNFDQLYGLLYDAVDSITDNYDKRAGLIISIADAQYHDSLIVEKEINAMAMLVKILEII